jgi:hypothetical protein
MNEINYFNFFTMHDNMVGAHGTHINWLLMCHNCMYIKLY